MDEKEARPCLRIARARDSANSPQVIRTAATIIVLEVIHLMGSVPRCILGLVAACARKASACIMRTGSVEAGLHSQGVDKSNLRTSGAISGRWEQHACAQERRYFLTVPLMEGGSSDVCGLHHAHKSVGTFSPFH